MLTHRDGCGPKLVARPTFESHLTEPSSARVLVVTRRPLVKTRTIDLIGFQQLPAGHNATVCVMSYSGYDIEDALIMNAASLDRGLGRCMVLKKFTCALKKFPNGSAERNFPPPDASSVHKSRAVQLQRFRVLEDDGICGVGERLAHGDILVNKHTPINTRDDMMGRDPDLLPPSAYRPSPLSYKGPSGHENT
eukprot:6173975-Pleurochrysis_carterae.AAC.3